MADVRNVCVSVKSSPFSCRRGALDVNKEDRLEEVGMVRRKSRSCGGYFVDTAVIF